MRHAAGVSRIRKFLVVAFAIGTAVLVSGCGDSQSPNFERVDPAEFAPIESDLMLEFIASDETTTAMSLAQLETVEMVTVELFEPFVEARSTFQGPTFAALVAELGWESDSKVHVLALDDYSWQVSVGDLISMEAVIATRERGAAIPLDKGGPTRIVFPDHSSAHDTSDGWVWSLKSFKLVD